MTPSRVVRTWRATVLSCDEYANKGGKVASSVQFMIYGAR